MAILLKLPQSGYSVDLSAVLPGNSINLTYTDTATSTQHQVTIIRVDDPAALPLSNAGAAPNTQTIRSGEYLLSRPLFIYVSTDALENNAAVRPFVDFYLSPQVLQRAVEAARYVTLQSNLEDAARQHYEDGVTGTVFNAEGEPKGGDLEAALQQQAQ